MSKQSIRVQMYPETKRYLEQIALEYNCLYGNKPSISELLEQIRIGRLIVSKASVNLPNRLDSSTIGLRFEVPRYLNGTISVISKKIVEYQGDIIAVKLKSEDDLDILQILLFFPEKNNLGRLIAELESIHIKEVAHFNSNSELLSIASQFEFIGSRNRVNTLDNFLHKRMIFNLYCVMGLKIKIRNQVGLLAKITYQIAETRLLIHSISQNIGNNKHEDIIDLFLYLRPTEKFSIAKQIEKIDDLVKKLKRIEEVTEVQPLGVDSLD
ncbi:MAG: hypothetical protein AAGE84_08275 [Cyanobacteria bacterium P01_G01_bin.39]